MQYWSPAGQKRTLIKDELESGIDLSVKKRGVRSSDS